jgi:hypothetical protein
MAVRESGGATLIDVLDRILDKGIVIDAWIRVSVVGIDLLTVEARIIVASFETYLNYGDALALRRLVAIPPSTVPSKPKRSDKESELPTRSRALGAKAGS